MDKIEDFVLGKVDGVKEDPIGFRKTVSLSLHHQSSRQTLGEQENLNSHYFGGGYIRGPYSTEPARLGASECRASENPVYTMLRSLIWACQNITWDQLNYDIANSDVQGLPGYSGTFETIKQKDPDLHERIFNPTAAHRRHGASS